MRGALERGARGDRGARAAASAGVPADAISHLSGGDRARARRARDAGRARRPDHPARRRGAEGGAPRARDRARDLRRVGQLPRLRRRRRRPRRTRSRSRSTRRSSGPASATRPRRCSCTATSPSTFLPAALAALHDAGVELRGDERTRALAGASPSPQPTDADWATEYLALTLAVAVVDSLDDAIEHISAHGTGHSEAIVTRDAAAARRFQHEVDAACVYVNASTRFTDGAEFGMGAEIGNSTQKLHARGPIGLRELCAFKYLVEGDGHVRR